MKPAVIVYKLLEDDEEDNPKAFLRGAMRSARARRLNKFPEELRPLMVHASDSFLAALGDAKLSEEFIPGPEPTEWWPHETDNPEQPWTKYLYHTEFTIDRAQLSMNIISTAEDGYVDLAEHVPYSLEARSELRHHYSRHRWLSARINYELWVAQTGSDPLGFFPQPRGAAFLKRLAREAARQHEKEDLACRRAPDAGGSRVVP